MAFLPTKNRTVSQDWSLAPMVANRRPKLRLGTALIFLFDTNLQGFPS